MTVYTAASFLFPRSITNANKGSIRIHIDNRRNDMRAVKKNCTIPGWLNYAAEKAGINFSQVLQSALKQKLKITEGE